MNSKKILSAAIILGAAGSLAGCATHSVFEQPGDAAWGEANRQTMMAQVVDPTPVYDEPMVTSGDHAADAVSRYRNDNVKEPDSIRTTNAGVSGPR